MTPPAVSNAPVLSIEHGSLGFGDRTLWSELSLEVERGEFLAVLGANGSGKTSLLTSILGQQPLDGGEIRLAGEPVAHGDRRFGYIPQQKLVTRGIALRGRDLVQFGLDGHRFGLPISSRADRERAERAIERVGASAYAGRQMGELSGGEQQRLRVAQAIVSDPLLLLCDEPLISLDLQHQRGVAELIDDVRRERGTSVVFVTHDVNPILGMVDRILYLAGGRFRVGTPDEVLQSSVLTELYGTPVEVFRSQGRVIVAGVPDAGGHVHHVHEAEHHE